MHREELSRQSERLKHEYTREVQNFALLVQGRHEACRAVYQALLKVEGAIVNPLPIIVDEGLPHDETRLMERLAAAGVPEQTRGVLLDRWRQEPGQAEIDTREALEDARAIRAYDCYQQYVNTRLTHALYMSATVADALTSANAKLSLVLSWVQFPNDTTSQKIRAYLGALGHAVADVRHAMVTDLSRGDFS